MFYIRADANNMIASGHIMRCMTIAAAIERLGEPCTFICADRGPERLLKEQGFPMLCLNTPYDELEQELGAIKKLIQEKGITKLLLDSYFTTEAYLRELSRDLTVFYLDDEARFPYPVHTIINYGVHYGSLPYREQYEGKDTRLLLGSRYIPVRREFCFGGITVGPEVKNILITTGGSDPFHISAELVRRLLGSREAVLGRARLHIVCGPFYDNREQLSSIASEESRAVIHEHVTNMAGLMRTADAAVSAGGTTLYELCACGVPTVCFTFAPNQTPGALELSRLEAIDYAGGAEEGAETVVERIIEKLSLLCESRELRERRSQTMRALVDGKGAQRLARYCVYGTL